MPFHVPLLQRSESMLRKCALTATIALGLVVAAGSRAHAGPIIYAMAGSGNGHLYGVDIGANTTTLIGTMPNGSGWSTVGETPDGTLFFMQRFLADIHIYSVAANNIHVSAGTVTNLM